MVVAETPIWTTGAGIATSRNRYLLLWELHRTPPRVEEVLPRQAQTVGRSMEEAVNRETKQSGLPWGKIILG